MVRFEGQPMAESGIHQINLQNFEEFYTDYFPKVYNYVRFRVRDPHDTDDLTSKIFERVLANTNRYNAEKGSFSAWIFAIANNIVIDYFKTKTGPAKKISFNLLTNLISSGKNPEHKYLDRELKNNLLAVLQEIDDVKRAIIALKFWSGLNNRQIAEISGLSESNIGTIIYRTLKQLKVKLAKRGVANHE